MKAYNGSSRRYVRGVLFHYVGIFVLLVGIFLTWVTAFGLPIDSSSLCHGPLSACEAMYPNAVLFYRLETIAVWVGLTAIPLGAILLLRSGISKPLADRRGKALTPF
jgi:hypothetical protein